MSDKTKKKIRTILKSPRFFLFSFVFLFAMFIYPNFIGFGSVDYEKGIVKLSEKVESLKKKIEPIIPPLDTELYDQKLIEIANNPPYTPPVVPEGQLPPPSPVYPWPAKDNPYPRDSRAILPFKRIVAYYGNLYSTKMGVLGEYEESIMFSKLDNEAKKWELADPNTPVQKALHYIAVVAQGSTGADGMYRARMPDSEIDKVLAMAEKINAIVFLDIQNGFSTVEKEIPKLEKYLKMPNVHLGLDPEFSMKSGIRPGKIVGTMDATDINFAANYLANLVKTYDLPPKILVVHRYTQKMLTNYQNINPLPEVQIVIHMDGWGGKAKKINTYKQFVFKEPVQFTGFKLFYKNDVKEPNTVIFSPEELIKLNPRPSYIQYQ